MNPFSYSECRVDHPALPALFDPQLPDHPVLWAVFRGRHTGRALVDDVHHPTQCVLRTDAYLTFASRQLAPEFLAAAITYFRRVGPIWLIWPNLPETCLVPPSTDLVTPRLAFYEYDPQAELFAHLRQRLPPGFVIQRIGRHLLERCEWREDMEFYCGSLDNFLVNGLGLCLLHNDEIIVEAYVSSFGDGQAEIGAITHSEYRGRGYAPIACAYLVELLAQRGYLGYWSCDTDNLASARVAQKLGFQQKRAYQVLEYGAAE